MIFRTPIITDGKAQILRTVIKNKISDNQQIHSRRFGEKKKKE